MGSCEPHHGSELVLSHVDEAVDDSVSGEIGHVQAVKRGNRAELEVHRAKGHEHCIKAIRGSISTDGKRTRV